MKKLATLLLAAGLVFCGVTGASAIDFKAKGQWIMSFDYGNGGTGASEVNGTEVYGYGVGGSRGPDNFNANQRVRLQLDAVASESLSGTVFFEIGETKWGNAGTGGALGADGVIVEIKQAYLDWIVPSTQLKVRMGIQPLSLPAYTTDGSMVFNSDTAAIVLSNKFSDNVSLTAFWARPLNDNYVNEYDVRGGEFSNDSSAYLDNADVFGLALPLSFDGFKMVPWATYMMVGQNIAREGVDLAGNSIANGAPVGAIAYGLLPMGAGAGLTSPANLVTSELYPYGNVWHVGLTGEITAADPFRIAWDFNYGFADFGYVEDFTMTSGGNPWNSRTKDFAVVRHGFYGSLLFEYKMNWGTPGIYGWYSSGDDEDPFNGSERMPTINNGDTNNGFSNFAGNGNPYIAREGLLGTTLIGTWGVGVRLKDFSFVEDLKHTFRVNYFNGTNDTAMAKYVGNGGLDGNGYYQGGNGMYLTTSDHAFEFGLTTDYQIYENLKLYVDMAYLSLSFDQSNDVWGDNYVATDAWNINASFVYSF